jgi:hypothetical protein
VNSAIDRWVQILGALGIFAGLYLVSIELGQGALLGRAELGSGSMSYRQNLLTSIQGEGLADALATAIDDPADLSTQQQVILDAWYDDVMGQVLRQSYLLSLGVFKDPIEPFARTQARVYFGNAYAQAWWQHNKGHYSETLVNVMDPVISSLSPDRDRREFATLQESASKMMARPVEDRRPAPSPPPRKAAPRDADTRVLVPR